MSQKGIIIETNELHTLIRKKLPKWKIIMLGTHDLWPADIILMTKRESKWWLQIYAECGWYIIYKLLKKKNGINVSKAFE